MTQGQDHPYQTVFENVATNAGQLSKVSGLAATVIRCQNAEEMLTFAQYIEGQLMATLHLEKQGLTLAKSLVQSMEKKPGRI